MVDIRLISILSGGTTPGVQQTPSAAGVTAQSAGILAQLPGGSILSGFIVNRDPQGNPILRTDSGDVVFASKFFLKIGSEVTIRVDQYAGQTRAHILSVNGEPPEVAAQKSAFSQEPEVIVGREQQSSQQRPAYVASSPAVDTVRAQVEPAALTAMVISPPPAKAGEPAPPLLPGTQLVLKLVTVTPPAPENAAAPAAPQTLAAPPSNPASYASYARTAGLPPAAPPAAAPSAVAPPPATTKTVPPTAAAPEAGKTIAAAPSLLSSQADASLARAHTPPSAPTPPPHPGQMLAATVLGKESGGEVAVQTPLGIIRLPPSEALPAGSRIMLEIVDIKPAGAPPPQANALAPATQLAREWTTLQQIFSLLTAEEGGAPGALPWLLSPALPSQPAQSPVTPQAVSAGLLLFMIALRGGDFRNWLGAENVRWLEERGHADLVKKAEGEFMNIARQLITTSPQPWQSVFFPLAVNGELHQVRMFLKRDRKKKEKAESKDDDTRFVVEMSLSQLGEMQMDGFVRRRDKAIGFDLVIRSLLPLAEGLQRDILEIYTKTGELTGYQGQLLFQAVREFPVHPMEELIAQQTNSVMA